VFNAGGNIAPDPDKIVCSLHRSKTPRYFLLYLAHTEVSFTALLMEGEVECPPPDEDKEERKGKRGPIKRSKARNLFERLINYEDEVLGFMTDERILPS
jgi:hypothetical protein